MVVGGGRAGGDNQSSVCCVNMKAGVLDPRTRGKAGQLCDHLQSQRLGDRDRILSQDG